MIVANIKSNADLQAKKDLQKQLLELEVANEALKEQRQKDSGNKDLEAKRLPDYKTSAEVLKDKVSLEKKALDNILELGFNYTDAGQLVNWISTQNRLADFTTGFKGIKKDLTEEYDKSVLTPEFVKNYLDNYFIDLDANLGKRFSREIGYDVVKGGVNSIEDLEKDLPTNKDIEDLKQIITSIFILGKPSPNIQTLGEIVISGLNVYQTILPDEELRKTAINLSQNERIKLVRRYRGLLNKSQYINALEMSEITKKLQDADEDEKIILPILLRMVRQLGYLTPQTLNAFVRIREDLIKTTKDDPLSNYAELRKEADAKIETLKTSEDFTERLSRAEEIGRFKIKPREEGGVNYEDVKQFVKNEQKDLQKKINATEYAKLVRDENYGQLNRNQRKKIFELARDKTSIDRTFTNISDYRLYGLIKRTPEELGILINGTDEEKEELKVQAEHSKKLKTKSQNRTLRNNRGSAIAFLPPTEPLPSPLKLRNDEVPIEELGAETIDPFEGRGLLSKLKKHFKGDEKLLRKVAKALEEDSSSDEEEMREVNRHIKATDKVDKMIEKKVGKGEFLPKAQRDAIYSGLKTGLKKIGLGGSTDVPFKATRIPTSKVGKGVNLEKEDNPTYRQFGKYVIHIPHLLNNNTANFKYPSLGSIPTIKPLTISTDYKDLLLDVLQSGKLNKKELERLPQNEIKHFERVAVGAGLVEQLGMKVGNTDEDKADAKRFEILRGEYLAGNNNEKMLKELRQLITKFINSGRLHKTEGFNLLLELSTI